MTDMSFTPPALTGDSLLDYFKRLIYFKLCANRMLSAKTDQEFLLWFEKANAADHRSTFLFLQKNKDVIPRPYILSVRKRFWQTRRALV